MKKYLVFFVLFSELAFCQNIRFDVMYKWDLPLGRNSDPTIELKEPLRVELKDNQLKMYYPMSNKFYFETLDITIDKVTEIKDGKKVYYLLAHEREGFVQYIRIAKDYDPNYGDLYGIEIPKMEKGVVIGYETFY
ncbi:MAG: hypothetical protein U5K51_00545 [Flavobacteriaceae bacterium]|nr:hypothetical protein [Flavobacteriaceae bacterium]